MSACSTARCDEAAADCAGTAEGSFEGVIRNFVIADSSFPVAAPDEVEFTLFLPPHEVGDEVEGVFGQRAKHALASFQVDGVRYRMSSSDLELSAGNLSLRFGSLELVAQDGGEGLATTALSGTIVTLTGDVVYRSDFEADLSAVRDATAPSLSIVGVTEERNVADRVVVEFSEPISSEIAWRLSSPEHEIELSAPTGSTYVSLVSAETWLEFGQTYRLRSEPAFSDLGNLVATEALPTLGASPDPGTLGLNGFEGEVFALLGGGTSVVTADDGYEPLEGERSLMIPIDGRFTARIQIGDAERLLFDARTVGAPGSVFLGSGRIAAPDGRGEESVAINVGPVESASDTTAYGPVGQIEHELSRIEGDEIVLDIVAGGCTGFCPQPAALLVDRLRIE